MNGVHLLILQLETIPLKLLPVADIEAKLCTQHATI